MSTFNEWTAKIAADIIDDLCEGRSVTMPLLVAKILRQNDGHFTALAEHLLACLIVRIALHDLHGMITTPLVGEADMLVDHSWMMNGTDKRNFAWALLQHADAIGHNSGDSSAFRIIGHSVQEITDADIEDMCGPLLRIEVPADSAFGKVIRDAYDDQEDFPF